MEIAIVIAGAIGLLGILRIIITLAVFEVHKNKSRYNYEETRHKRAHDPFMDFDPRYFT